MSIDRCICHNISFEEIKKVAEIKDFQNLEELREANICSNSCKICGPYISEVLKTGRTSFIPGSIYHKTEK
jgi:bacterioferritin-associated ferredoxin